MKKVADRIETQRIKFELNIEELNGSLSIAARSHDQTAGYPRPEESARLDYPEELMLALEDWRTAYHVYYKHISGDQNTESSIQTANSEEGQPNPSRRRGRRARGGNQAEKKLSNLISLEKKLKQTFLGWLEHPRILLIRDFIRQKIGVSTADSGVQFDDILFEKIDIFINCRGEHSKEFRKLPWSEWLILPENISKKKSGLISFFHTEQNLNSDSILAPVRKKKPRFLVLVGEYQDLNFKEEIELFQKLEAKNLADVQFLNANDAEFSTERKFLDELKKSLQDDRGWTAIALVCHGDDENKMGEIIISRRISFTVSRFAESLLMAKRQGLQFAFLGCCRGTLIAQDLIQYGLHQVFFLTEKVGDRLTKQFTKQFVEGLIQSQSVEMIWRQVVNYFAGEVRKSEYPSAALLPQIFYHPDSQVQDLQLKKVSVSQKLKFLAKQLLPQSKNEAIALVGLLLLSTLFPVRDLLIDSRLFIQALVRTPLILHNVDKSQSPPIQIISIDQESINKARIRNPNFKTSPSIDRKYLAEIVDKLNDLNIKNASVNYLLSDEYHPNLEQSIRQYIVEDQPWLTFASNIHVRDPEYPLSQFANSQWSFWADHTYIPWTMDIPKTFYCDQACPFAFRSAHLYQLRQWLTNQEKTLELSLLNRSLLAEIKSTDEFVDQQNQDAVKSTSQEFSFKSLVDESTFSFISETDYLKQFKISYLNNDQVESNQNIFDWLSSLFIPISLIDYSIPPSHIYQTISAEKFLVTDLNKLSAEKQDRLRNSLVIIASGHYREVEKNHLALPLATRYWCSMPQRLTPNRSNCNRLLTTGEMQAYAVFQYIHGRNLREVSLLWTTLFGVLVAKILQKYLLNFDAKKRSKKVIKILSIVVLIYALNLVVFMQIGLLIPLLVPSVTIFHYTFFLERYKKFKKSI